MEQRFGKREAVCCGQADHLKLGDSLDRRLVHARDHEVGKRPPLQLSSTLKESLLLAGDARLQPLAARPCRGFFRRRATRHEQKCTANGRTPQALPGTIPGARSEPLMPPPPPPLPAPRPSRSPGAW